MICWLVLVPLGNGPGDGSSSSLRVWALRVKQTRAEEQLEVACGDSAATFLVGSSHGQASMFGLPTSSVTCPSQRSVNVLDGSVENLDAGHHLGRSPKHKERSAGGRSQNWQALNCLVQICWHGAVFSSGLAVCSVLPRPWCSLLG